MLAAEGIRATGAEALVIDADLGEPATAQSVVDQTLATFGRIDALLNIAGAVPQIDLFNAAFVALAKAFSDRGITDGVQVNSVLPGPVMTGRRQSYLEHWAPLHNLTVEQRRHSPSRKKPALPAMESRERSPN